MWEKKIQTNTISYTATHKIDVPAICSSVNCSVCEISNRVNNILWKLKQTIKSIIWGCYDNLHRNFKNLIKKEKVDHFDFHWLFLKICSFDVTSIKWHLTHHFVGFLPMSSVRDWCVCLQNTNVVNDYVLFEKKDWNVNTVFDSTVCQRECLHFVYAFIKP